jgi:hypothetical protein
MAKKVRRVKKNNVTATTSSTQATTTVMSAADSGAVPARSKQTSEEQFHDEYAYVVRDLRHVLLLSAAMFALLIVLNLLLN